MLNDFPGEEKIFHSADSIKDANGGDVLMYPVEYLNDLNASGLPLSKLRLKIGCSVMVLQNLNPTEGVCNGSRGIVTWMTNKVIMLEIKCSFQGSIFIYQKLRSPFNYADDNIHFVLLFLCPSINH